MKNSVTEFSLFPDKYIDAIDADPGNNYFSPVLNEVLHQLPLQGSVCDVGCGNGVFSIALKSRLDCHLTGCDGSLHALAKAKELGFDEVHCVKDLCNDRLPLGNDTFDLVICKDVLEHLLDPMHLVSELARIVKPGGMCLLHVPNHFPIKGRLHLLFGNSIDSFGFFPDATRWNYPHIRFFDKASLLELAGLCGFTLSKNLSWHFFHPALVKRCFPWLARAIGTRYPDATSLGITLLFIKNTHGSEMGPS